jgi:hypothetical protein
MRFRQSARHFLLVPALGAVAGMAVAACGSSGSSSSQPSSSPSSSSSSSPSSSSSSSASASPTTSGGSGTARPSSAQAAIEANWAAFFLSSTPISRRVALLQNGSQFEPVIKAQAGSALASSATSKVAKVTLVSPTQAKVSYSIFVGGTPALANQTGVAVLQNGVWKVGDASFCGLLTVENSGKTSGLPAACRSAG